MLGDFYNYSLHYILSFWESIYLSLSIERLFNESSAQIISQAFTSHKQPQRSLLSMWGLPVILVDKRTYYVTLYTAELEEPMKLTLKPDKTSFMIRAEQGTTQFFQL
jgi:hypothetical protein